MARNNAYLARQKAALDEHVQRSRRYTIQQCCDFMLLAAAKEFGFGSERLKRLMDAWVEQFNEYADMLTEDIPGDKDFEYTKSVVDRRLKAACGDWFQDWSVRYGI
jgi:hypothetical protein